MDESLYKKQHLFKKIAAGDEDAFREIFHHCNARLYPFVLKLTRSESAAEDIVQETFLRLWICRSEVGTMAHPLAWLYKVASNASLSWLRSHAAELRRIEKINSETPISEDHVIEHLSLKEIQMLVAEAVELLPPKRQQIYRLSREHGMNYKEIAEEMHVSPHTIKNQLVSALKFIKEYLYRYGGIAIPFLLFLFYK